MAKMMILELLLEDGMAIKSNFDNIFDPRPKYFGFYVKRAVNWKEWCFTVLIFAEEFGASGSGENMMKDHL
jgi:hypothetical protein